MFFRMGGLWYLEVSKMINFGDKCSVVKVLGKFERLKAFLKAEIVPKSNQFSAKLC